MIKFIVEERGQCRLQVGKEETQAQRCGGDKGLLFTELKGKERRIHHMDVKCQSYLNPRKSVIVTVHNSLGLKYCPTDWKGMA